MPFTKSTFDAGTQDVLTRVLADAWLEVSSSNAIAVEDAAVAKADMIGLLESAAINGVRDQQRLKAIALGCRSFPVSA